MTPEPSTNEVLDDRSLADAQENPDPGSDLELDGMPLDELIPDCERSQDSPEYADRADPVNLEPRNAARTASDL